MQRGPSTVAVLDHFKGPSKDLHAQKPLETFRVLVWPLVGMQSPTSPVFSLLTSTTRLTGFDLQKLDYIQPLLKEVSFSSEYNFVLIYWIGRPPRDCNSFLEVGFSKK